LNWSANPDRNREVDERARDNRTDRTAGRKAPPLVRQHRRRAADRVARRIASGAIGGALEGVPRLVNLRERRPFLARYESAPRHIVEARYLGDYKVWLEFNDGRKGVVDLSDELHGESLVPLRDRSRFSQFYLDYGLASIAWLDGQDFAPEFLYDKLTAVH